MEETVETGLDAVERGSHRGGGEVPPWVVSVVVNYCGLAETRACVESLLAVDYPSHSVVVIENGSGEAEAGALAAAMPADVLVIRSDANLGYGGGANVGLRWAVKAGARYAWVLNNDTTVDSRSVSELVRAMESDPWCAAVSPQIEAPVGPESPRGVWYAGGAADLRHVTTSHTLDLLETDALLVPTGFVSGCAMFLRIPALVETGLFWEHLFLYWEDVELSLRLRAAGWHLRVAPAARIRHAVHGSVGSVVANFYYYRNAILVAQRELGLNGGAQAILALTRRAGRRWLACMVKGRRPWPVAETRGLLAGIIGITRGDAREGRPSAAQDRR